MSDAFTVRYTAAASDDLLRLFDFLLYRAQRSEDFDVAQATVAMIRQTVEQTLSASPFMFRKAGGSPFLRELLIPCKRSGYVALYEIDGPATVTVLAVRHQLEDDYH